MKNLDKALENLKFDKRMTGWNLSNDKLTESEMDSHIKGLEDLSANADPLTLEDTGSDDTDSTEVTTETPTPEQPY